MILPSYLQKKADREDAERRKELEARARDLIDYLIEKKIKVGDFELISKFVVNLLNKEFLNKEIKELCQPDLKSAEEIKEE